MNPNKIFYERGINPYHCHYNDNISPDKVHDTSGQTGGAEDQRLGVSLSVY